MTARFAGRRALVTGASRGIGVGIAERLAAEGAQVAIVGRTLNPGERNLAGSLSEVVERIGRYGTTVAPLVADLTDEESRSDVVARAADALGGPIDILVNNAAAAIYGPMADFPLRRRRLTFEINVHAPLDLAQQVIPGMRERGEGWIVNLTSGTANLRPGPPFDIPARGTEMAIYGTSKAALNRMTNGLGAELVGTGIRVNAVTPRFGVATEGAVGLIGHEYDDVMESMEEMVEAAVALCDCGTDVTGQVFVSLDLLRDWHVNVRQLDGSAM